MNEIPDRPATFRAGTRPGSSAAIPATTPEASGPRTYLADISEFQPDIADAAYLAWSKAIVFRAMYGSAHDDAAWYGGSRRAALHAGGARFIGIYMYLAAGQDGAAQARAFHQLVGAIQPGEVFIADFEEGSHGLLTAWYNEMIALYGQQIAPHLWTYTGLNFGAAQGVLPVQWLADYTSAEPASPHKLWQFTSAYPVPGVGSCDCSVFHGTIDELAGLACQPAAASFHVSVAPPGWWRPGGPLTLTGPAPDGSMWETSTGDGKTWTEPARQ